VPSPLEYKGVVFKATPLFGSPFVIKAIGLGFEFIVLLLTFLVG
jgi:hypothetical protein